MDQNEPHCSTNPSKSEKQKLNEKNKSSENETVAAVPVNKPNGRVNSVVARPNVVQTAAMLKLDIDCFEELFEYLSFVDMVSMGRTCKRLQQVVGYCYHQNYPMLIGLMCICEVKGTADKTGPFRNNDGSYKNISNIDMKVFSTFHKRLRIYPADLEYFALHQSKFHQLKEINFEHTTSDAMEMTVDRLKPTLSKLKALDMHSCNLDKFHDMLSLCSNVTHLRIRCCEGSFDWLNGKYPTLEYLKIQSINAEAADKFPMFLERNPNIRKLAIDISSFWGSRDSFRKANIKLHELAILFGYTDFEEPDSFCHLLNELHGRGFFKQLQLYIGDRVDIWNQKMADQLSTINGLIKLKFAHGGDLVKLSGLMKLQELVVDHFESLPVLTAIQSIDLKRIIFGVASIKGIMPFIRHSVKMQQIRIEHLTVEKGVEKGTYVIDLVALNREREKLPKAKKITLYVEEKIFLATKWAFGDIDLKLIRLKRSISFDYNNDFRFFMERSNYDNDDNDDNSDEQSNSTVGRIISFGGAFFDKINSFLLADNS